MSDAPYRVEWTKLALERVLELAEFRFPGDMQRAQVWMGRVVERAEGLQIFPNRGRRVSSDES